MWLHTALEDLGVVGSIAVTTGRAFCGVIGSTERREYTMMGDVMNRAARLMKAAAVVAPDAPVLCDIETFEMAQDKISFKGLEALELKGMQGRIPIYQPLGEKATTQRARTSMVGRERERLLFAEVLQDLLRHNCSTLIIEGDAGIGKSRLVDDLIRQAEKLDLQCYLGAGDSVEKTTNYFAWRAIYSDLLKIEATAGAKK